MKWSTIFAAFSLCADCLCSAEPNLTHNLQSAQKLLQDGFKPPQVFRNVNLVRNTNLEKGFVREQINVVIENVDTTPQSEYYLPFDYDTVGKVGGFEAREKQAAESEILNTYLAATSSPLSEEGARIASTQYYIIELPEPLQSKAQITLTVSYHILSSLTPLPASIPQDGKQYLTYSFSAYWPSAYPTVQQKTKLKLPTTDVPDYTQTTGLKSSSDPERQGTSFTYGPYETGKVPAGSVHPVSVRYEFTKPVVACTWLERDVEVSHWGGNLAVEERYWLENRAARLLENFSRVKWTTQKYYNKPTTALKELPIPLKPGSVDPYFTDEIGNVSTSRYRPNDIRDASLDIQPRYPVFGGWKYSFRIGWNNNLSDFLRKLGGENVHILRVPFIEGPKIKEGVFYEHAQIRIILPEGAENVRWNLVGGVGVPDCTYEISRHKTFMDTTGRTALTLNARSLIDEAREISLVVRYDYSFSAAFRKPLSIFVGTFVIFVTAWLVGQVDISIGPKKTV